MLNSAEVEVREALAAFLEAMRKGDGTELRGSMDQLERLACRKAKELPPRLLHFLERRSYAKAFAYLEGESDVPRGGCGGKGEPS